MCGSNESQQLTVVYQVVAASKVDEGQYICNAIIGGVQMNITFSLSVLGKIAVFDIYIYV